MSLPQPPIVLTDCSVIFNNTLYAYSSAGFQSLALVEGAKWKKFKSSGESVEGGVCVGSTPKDSTTAALFIVGGTSSSSEYAGLQKFTYSTGKWETIKSTDSATKDRVYHSAVYLSGPDSILTYAGSTNGKPDLSQQTFLIQASEPYSVLSSSSVLASAAVAPLLLPWSDTEAVLIGGTTSNTDVMIFDTADKSNSMAGSWRNSGVTLAEPLLKNTTVIKGTIVNGNDQSKHLYTFDPTTSPNTVNRTVLIDGDGHPVGQSAPVQNIVITQRGETNIYERDTTANNWPSYNATLAPNSTRTDYSIAKDDDGLVVMTGGNQDDVLCMFNVYENSWLNATHILVPDTLTIQSQPSTTTFATSSTTTTLPTTTSSPVSTTSAANDDSTTSAPAAAVPAPATRHGLAPTTILGISLGTIFGAAILLVLILMLLRRRRQRRSFIETGHARRASGIPDTKEFFNEDMAKTSGGYFRGHAQQESQNSFSSVAMFLGKPQKPVLQRKASSNGGKRVSNDGVYSQDFKNTISRPQPQPSAQLSFLERSEKLPTIPAASLPRPRAPPSEPQDSALRRSSGWNRYWSGASTPHILGMGSTNANSRRNTEVSDESSRYSDMHHRMTQDSATVPPLQVDGRPSFHRVNSGSPTVSQYDPRISEGVSGHIERPVSPVSSSGYSSGIPPSVHENWDPTEPQKPQKPWGTDRAPSSAYSHSTLDEPSYQTALGARQPTGMSRQPQLQTSTDMSWLNLGDHNNNNGRSYR